MYTLKLEKQHSNMADKHNKVTQKAIFKNEMPLKHLCWCTDKNTVG